MELLGPSLEDLFSYCNRRFSLKTILLIADQAIRRIEHIHRRYIHRDIKPDNFLLGTGRQGNILYTVDFGVAKEFSGEERYLSLRGVPFGGTSRYASINNHKGLRKQPLEKFVIAICLLTELKTNHGGMIWNPLGTCLYTSLVGLYHGKV